jgi:protein disulfide-isomerase A6
MSQDVSTGRLVWFGLVWYSFDIGYSLTERVCVCFFATVDPTIKYFVDGDKKGKDYKGGRDYDSLKTFIEETLEVKCDVKNPVECTDKEKGYIEKMSAKASEDRVKQIERLEKMAGESMKAELKGWLRERLHILRGLEA